MIGKMNRRGFSLVEVSLSIGTLVIAGAVAYYFLYLLPQQNSAGSIDLKVAPPSPSQSQAVAPAQPVTPPVPTQAPVVFEQLNKPFVIDNIQYTVHSAVNLGNQLTSYAQLSQGKYIQVKLTALNVGTQTVTVKPILYLMDSGNRQFQTTAAFLYQPPSGYKIYDSSYGQTSYGMSFSPISLQPGFSQNLVALFEIPTTSKGLMLAMGNGTTQDYYISLGL